MNTPGIKLICRPSYEYAAAATGSPWDYPLTSRYDENNAIFVFDNAFISWENVLIHRDIQRLKDFYPRSGFFNGFTLQGCTRLSVKLDFIAGLLYKAARDKRSKWTTPWLSQNRSMSEISTRAQIDPERT